MPFTVVQKVKGEKNGIQYLLLEQADIDHAIINRMERTLLIFERVNLDVRPDTSTLERELFMLAESDTVWALDFTDSIENTNNDTLYSTFLQPRDKMILKVLNFILLAFTMLKSTCQINKRQGSGAANLVQLTQKGQSPCAMQDDTGGLSLLGQIKPSMTL